MRIFKTKNRAIKVYRGHRKGFKGSNWVRDSKRKFEYLKIGNRTKFVTWRKK